MARSNWQGRDHGALAGLEVVAAPLAVAGTTLVLAVAGSAVAATQYVASLAGVSGVVVDAVVWTIAFVAAGFLLSVAGMLVGEYRRFLDRPRRTGHLVALALVPAVGLVGPYAYAFATGGALSISAPLFVIVVLAAHALAFRTIAWVSRRRGHRREGFLAGTLAGVPVTLALIDLVTGNLLGPVVDDAGQLLLGALAPTPLPTAGPVLVAAPLAVAGLYAGYRTAVDRSVIGPVTAPDAVTRLPRVPNVVRLLRRRATPAVVRARDVAADRLSATGPLSRASGGSDSPPVPTPPGSTRSSRDRSRSSRSGSRGSSGVPRPPRSASAGRAAGSDRGNAAADDGVDGTDGAAGADAADAADPDAAEAADAETADSPGPDSADSDAADSADSDAADGDDEDSADPSDADVASASTDATDEEQAQDDGDTGAEDTAGQEAAAGDAGTHADAGEQFRSDTQIFSASPDPDSDTDPDTDPDAGTSLATCPDCGEDLPSDGTFEFCPICGAEL